MTAVKREVIVKRAIRFGSMPSSAVDDETTEFLSGKFLIKSASKNNATPNGTIILLVNPAIVLSQFKISEVIGLWVLASTISLAA